MINRDYIYMLIFCNRNQLKKIFHKNKETYIENSYEMF